MRQFLNANTLANDVRMRRSIWKGAFLFVEGESDERFYGIFVDPNGCQIIVSHGRANLFEACDILTVDEFEGFLGIVDADLTHLGEPIPAIANVLMTDFHDAECFMLRGVAFERVLGEFGSKEKVEYWSKIYGPNIRQHLLVHSSKVGFLLWHSIESDLNLAFTNLEVKEFANRESLEVELDKLIEHAKNKSQKHKLATADLIVNIGKLQEKNPDLWHVVRGPDLIELLGYALRFALATWPAMDVSPDRLGQSLRLAYPAEEFAATELFESIKAWEKANPRYVILKLIGTGNLFAA